jgi:ABC-type Zn uptake system ZnuABC Zn-binding protein ZnuA
MLFLLRAAAVALVGVLLVGCSAPSEPSGGALRVVATTTQVGSVAAAVGGGAIDLTVLLRPGVEAHDFELTPEAGAAIERADVVLVSGAGLEDWLEDAIDSIGATDRVRDLSEGVDLRTADDGQVDPHYWLDGANAVVMVENARAALVAALPSGEAGFAARAAALVDRLEAADAEARALIGEVPEGERRLVTDHDALGYFTDAYGLEVVGSIFPSLDVASEPSAQQIEALVATIRDEGVAAIFTESAVNPALAEAIAAETGARLVEEPLYTDSLGPPGSGAETLDGMLVHNARVIRDGLLDG